MEEAVTWFWLLEGYVMCFPWVVKIMVGLFLGGLRLLYSQNEPWKDNSVTLDIWKNISNNKQKK